MFLLFLSYWCHYFIGYVIFRPDSESNIHYIFFDHSSFTQPRTLTFEILIKKKISWVNVNTPSHKITSNIWFLKTMFNPCSKNNGLTQLIFTILD